MQILGLLGRYLVVHTYFDAAVVFVTIFSLLIRLAMAILCKKKRLIFCEYVFILM